MKIETEFDFGDTVIHLDEVKAGKKNPIHYTVKAFTYRRGGRYESNPYYRIYSCVSDRYIGTAYFLDRDLLSLEQYEKCGGLFNVNEV